MNDDDDKLGKGLIPSPDDNDEIDLDELFDDDDDGIDLDGDDDKGLLGKAKEKFENAKEKIQDIKDKYEKGKETVEKGKKVVEKGKEWADNVKKAQETKRMADNAKKAKDAVDNTKKAVDAVKTAKNTADAVKATKAVADTAKAAAQTSKVAGGIVKGAQTVAHGISTAVQAVGHAISAFISSVAAFWYVYLIILAIILVIIIIVAVIAAVTAFFEMKTDPANMTTNSYITSECFYGIRSVYIDEEDLTNALELNYKQFAIEVIENIKLDNPDITVNITLPQLAEGTTLTNDIDLDDTIDQHIVKAMASIVATGGTGYTDSDFKDLYALIDFFGLTEEQLNKTKDYISQYFTDNNILQGENINVNTIIEDAFTLDASGEHDLSYITNICQKVMIKDEIATEEGLSDIKTRHYIASIYMPNKDINVTRSYYTIYGGSDTFTNNYKLIEENNGEKTIHAEKEMVGDSEIVDGFLVGTAELKQFTSISTENPNLFSSGISLFEAVKLTPKGSQYFQKIETKDSSGNTVTAYTWNPTDTSLLYLTFEASSSFIFTEFSFNATAK